MSNGFMAGRMIGANFEEDTLTFEMDRGYYAAAGKYVIVRESDYLETRQLAEQRAELLEALEQLLDKKNRQAALAQGSTSPYAKGAGSAIEIFAAEVRSAIANATQQRNATGGEG